MPARPDLTKQLVDALKAEGVKTTKSGKRGIAVDGTTIATVYDAANGSIRLFVSDKRGKLPAKLAKQFKLNETRGYAKLFKIEDDLTPAVQAIAFVAAIESDAKASKTASARKTSKTASTKPPTRKTSTSTSTRK